MGLRRPLSGRRRAEQVRFFKDHVQVGVGKRWIPLPKPSKHIAGTCFLSIRLRMHGSSLALPFPSRAISTTTSDTSKTSQVETYAELWYRDLYPRTDLRYYSRGDGRVEYDFVLHPGADAERLRWRMGGIEEMEVDKETGELVLCTSLGEVRKGAPYAYQMIEGHEVEVASAYSISGDEVQLALADYDQSLPLIVDPTVLEWSTYLGGMLLTIYMIWSITMERSMSQGEPHPPIFL